LFEPSLILAAAALCCAVTGTVHAPNGAPIARAHVVVGSAAFADSDASGRFSLTAPPGPQTVTISAAGFGATTIDRVDVHEGTSLDVGLVALTAEELRTIGQVRVDGRLALPRGATPTHEITRTEMDAAGISVVPDALQQIPSVTLARPDAGGQAAVSVVALRGPDPSETLVALDGQILNNTNTGDFDLSQFPVAGASAIDVTEGLGPENAVGANTIGGEVNIRTLSATRDPHNAFSLSYGSFGASSIGASSTGQRGRLGYAFAARNANTQGYIVDFPAKFAVDPNPRDDVTLRLNSWVRAESALANLTWTFSQRSDLRVRYFTLANVRDQSGLLDAPADPTLQSPGTLFSGPGLAMMAQGVRALLVSARAPLGSGSLVGSYAASGITTTFDGGVTASPYDVSNNDRLGTVTLGWERSASNVDVAAGGYSRYESLEMPAAFNAVAGEHSTAVYARVGFNAGRKLRLALNAYDTKYSTFGTSLDGRAGAIYDPDGRSNVRFSVGTGFRAPLLAELYVAPIAALLPLIDQNCVAPNGNANEKPEHVTTYELGYARQLDGATTLDTSFYWTNLRSPIELAYPLNARCPTSGPPIVAGQVVPVNISNAVYKGGAVRLARRFGDFFLRAEYGVNVAYPRELPESVANPTSGANLVPFQQFEGIPIQTGTLSLRYAHAGNHAEFWTTYKGKNNELNAGPYATVNGAIGKQVGSVDYQIGFRNLTDAVSGRFTRLGQGAPYPTPSGPLSTDLFVIEPPSVTFTVTVRK
jgi:outer membrane cobalamin receptor